MLTTQTPGNPAVLFVLKIKHSVILNTSFRLAGPIERFAGEVRSSTHAAHIRLFACVWGGVRSSPGFPGIQLGHDTATHIAGCILWQTFTGQLIVMAWTKFKNCFLKQPSGMSINRGGIDLVFRIGNSINQKLSEVVQVTQCGISPTGLAFAPTTTAYKFLALEPGSISPTGTISKFGQLAVVYVPLQAQGKRFGARHVSSTLLEPDIEHD